MENLITLLGLLFFMFLVLAASVEVILEIFRGTLECFGLTWVKGKVSLEDALKLASEFAPNNTELNTKLQAIKSTSEQITRNFSRRMETISRIEAELKDIAGTQKIEQMAAELNALASAICTDLDLSERKRIFILRFLAAVIGCILVWLTKFYVFQIITSAPEMKELNASISALADTWKEKEWLNIFVGGLACAAGSSYWHDKLDKIRNLKSLSQEFKNLNN
jgi:hypothetical protein